MLRELFSMHQGMMMVPMTASAASAVGRHGIIVLEDMTPMDTVA